MSELKPCPFCGGSAVYVSKSEIDKLIGTATTSCRECCSSSPLHNWNNRAETETEKHLTAIATKHATRADELYEALEYMVDQFGEPDGSDFINEADYLAVSKARKVLNKSRIEAEGD